MLTIGLTGGIGSGKSAAAEVLRGEGHAVVDADRAAHWAYRRGSGGYAALVKAFGREILKPRGEVDRSALAEIAFGDAGRRAELEGLVWPLAREVVERRLAGLARKGARAAFVEAALLLEAGWDDLADRIWVVDAPAGAVAERLRKGRTNTEMAERAMQMQLDGRSRLERARRSGKPVAVLSNGGSLEDLRRGVLAALAEAGL